MRTFIIFSKEKRLELHDIAKDLGFLLTVEFPRSGLRHYVFRGSVKLLDFKQALQARSM